MEPNTNLMRNNIQLLATILLGFQDPIAFILDKGIVRRMASSDQEFLREGQACWAYTMIGHYR